MYTRPWASRFRLRSPEDVLVLFSKPFGSLFGALIVGVFSSGLSIAGLDVLWQRFALGCLIIIAVGIDQWIRKVSN